MEEVALPVSSKAKRFPKARRLLKRTEFVRAQQAPAIHTKHFVLVAYARDDCEQARLGLVASRRVGNAVERNRAKRRVREWFRKHSELPLGADLVVILRTSAHQVSSAVLKRSLDRALVRLSNKTAARRQTAPASGQGSCDSPRRDTT